MQSEVLTVIQETTILGKDVRLYSSIEEPLFEASEVAGWLGVQNVSQMLKQAEIDETEKAIFKAMTNGGLQNKLFINLMGLKKVLSNSRVAIAKEILHTLDPDFYYQKTHKQTQFEIMLKNALKYHLECGVDLKQCPFNDKERYTKLYTDALNYHREHRIMNYKVDFFFEDFLLIVEYDENRHKYQKEEDKKRQYEIEKFLNNEQGNETWETDGSLVTFIRVDEGEEFKGIIEIITHLMSVFI